MRRLWLSSSGVALVLGFLATPTASAQQSLNFYVGGFTPTPIDARGSNDVLFQDSLYLSTLNRSNGIVPKLAAKVSSAARTGANSASGVPPATA